MSNDAAASYAESVPSSYWLRVPLVVVAAGAAVGSLLALVDREWLGGAVLLLTSALLASVMIMFARLAVRVDAHELRFGFGPFVVTLPAERIEAVEVERYRWLPYGGWGIRFATADRRAWSVPFAREGVSVRTERGRRYHVSSRRPAELARAIETLRAPGQTSGEPPIDA